jgi:hypothetical protein
MRSLLCVALALTGVVELEAAPPLYVPDSDSRLAQQGPVLEPIPETIPQRQSPAIIPLQSIHPAPQPVTTQPPALQPVPEYSGSISAYPPVANPTVPAPLYPHVRVKDVRRAHPLAVKQLIQAPNPCRGQCDPVLVEVCLPPCEPLSVDLGPRGQRITYNYGTHRVQVTSLRGVVTVDYDN